jgi:hypothetical protein
LKKKKGSAASLDDQFQAIADEAIEAAEQIDCSLVEFVDGLGTIIDALRDRKSVSEEEIEQRHRGA